MISINLFFFFLSVIISMKLKSETKITESETLGITCTCCELKWILQARLVQTASCSFWTLRNLIAGMKRIINPWGRRRLDCSFSPSNMHLCWLFEHLQDLELNSFVSNCLIGWLFKNTTVNPGKWDFPVSKFLFWVRKVESLSPSLI